MTQIKNEVSIKSEAQASTKYIPPMRRGLPNTNNSFHYSNHQNKFNRKQNHKFRPNTISPRRDFGGKYRSPNRKDFDYTSFTGHRPYNKSFYSDIENDRSTERNSVLEEELFDAKKEVSKGINFDTYENIPVETSGRDVPSPIEDFSEINNIHPQLLWNIKRSGFTKPTPVQKHAFPISVAQRDIMGCAQTGSGKTAAFLFPMIQMLLETGGGDEFAGCYETPYRRLMFLPSGIILSPTRELALQIHSQARKFLYRTGMRACVVYGGMDIRNQFRDLSKGVDILVATPGRLTDLLQRGKMSLRKIRFLILDEADRMLDMGFEPQIKEILSSEYGIPEPDSRQTMMFSATFPREIQFLAQKYMNDYIFVAVGRVGSTVDTIRQEVEFAEDSQKQYVLMNKLEDCTGLTLIFVERKRSADQIEYFLNQQGVQATSIHGDRNQNEREHALRVFKQGICKVLVATDVASRGLDIPNVTHVFNYDMPSSIDDYVHRIGRTGRCGNEGVAVSLITPNDNKKVLIGLIHMLNEAKTNVPIWLNNLAHQRPESSRSYRKSSRYGGRDIRQERNKGKNRKGFVKNNSSDGWGDDWRCSNRVGGGQF